MSDRQQSPRAPDSPAWTPRVEVPDAVPQNLRPLWRLLCCVSFLGFGGYCVTRSDLLISGAPAPFVGAVVVVTAVLGLLGVNVFRGGPLDVRKDPSRARDGPTLHVGQRQEDTRGRKRFP